MDPNETKSWPSCQEASTRLVDAGKKATKLIELIVEAAQIGNPEALKQSAAKLIVEVENFSDALKSTLAAVPPQKSPIEFADEIESAASADPSLGHVIRKDHRLLIGHTPIRVTQSNGGELITTIGSEQRRTTSAGMVLADVARVSKERFDYKRFVKALKEAFNYHVALRGVDGATAVVPLEEIRRMVNISRDGSVYSTEQMTDDIQRLVTVANDEMREAGIEFVPVPAAKVQFEFIEQTGNLIHLGGMRIEVRSKESS